MKRCPTCNRTFAEEHLSFCTEDGTPLRTVASSPDELAADETTRVRSAPGSEESGSSGEAQDSWRPENSYQPPGSSLPPGYASPSKSRTWPWVVGVLAIVLLAIVGVGIAAAMFVRNIARQNANVERRGVIVNLNRNTNSNANSNSGSSNWNDNRNLNANADDTTPPPTDLEKVLADLKALEEEWTVANIKADKNKLNQILADDYVGINEGKPEGKAQYLKTIRPDTAIQKWEFQNLKLSLSGDRASLSGVLQLDIKDENGQPQQVTFRFTDKFVWRDGRWQAVASEVNQVPVKPGTTV